ncbi:MAG: DUF3095 domain-containing protein [Balneolaceae bacterium]|nr:DUF3095 domain-containing protein [Balneolaceae bacterium]
MDSDSSETFYADLPVLESFFDVSDPENFHRIPDDWHLGVTDITNSTGAVQEGKYKTVNILGASPIVGFLNITTKEKFPFTFAGDGCAICVPPGYRAPLEEVFGASRKIGHDRFRLDLRAAVIPVRDIRDRGFDLQVARYRVSGVYSQAIFSGEGLGYAEELLKTSSRTQYHVPKKTDAGEVDFSGLECRWEEVRQRDRKVLTMLVKRNPRCENPDAVYENVLLKMREIFGFDDQTNPVDPAQLTMRLSLPSLMGEVKFRTFGMNWLQRLCYILKAETEIILGKLFMRLGYRSSETDWSRYKQDLALNSDHRKFDGMLRVVISGSERQIEELQEYLEDKFRQQKLAYGTHITDAAMITCMVFKYHRQHIHFVDGSDGGYVKAAQKLKERIQCQEWKFPDRS